MATPDQLAVEELDNDRDSALGEDVATNRNSLLSTQSLASSVCNFIHKHGRTYHSYHEGKYPFPNDEAEICRLDFQHALSTVTLGGRLHLSPIVRPQRVLDLGCGTGIWAIQYADLHPEAIVVGVDLSPIQPKAVPPNCSFEIFDYDDGWTFSDKFDFIHAGMMIGCIDNLDRLIQQAFDHLRPGGSIELLDVCPPACNDDTTLTDSPYHLWMKNMDQALRIIGRDPFLAEKYASSLSRAGFTNIVVHRIPQDGLPEDHSLEQLSLWQRRNITAGIEGFSKLPFMENLGWSEDELSVFLAEVTTDIRDGRFHMFWPIYVVYGQKSQTVIEQAG